MPYCDTCSKPDFQTSVTSHAFVACSLHERKAETAFPPTAHTEINGESIDSGSDSGEDARVGTSIGMDVIRERGELRPQSEGTQRARTGRGGGKQRRGKIKRSRKRTENGQRRQGPPLTRLWGRRDAIYHTGKLKERSLSPAASLPPLGLRSRYSGQYALMPRARHDNDNVAQQVTRHQG